MITSDEKPQRALVLHPRPNNMPQYVADYGVEEAQGLTEALQATVVDAIIVPLREIRRLNILVRAKSPKLKPLS